MVPLDIDDDAIRVSAARDDDLSVRAVGAQREDAATTYIQNE
jgi:hypothetical protein